MDEIPLFNGEPIEIDSWPTCGQFITMIEEHASKENFGEEDVKKLCFSKAADKAQEVIAANFSKPWSDLKQLMMQEFSSRLSIKEKVLVRKNLQQQQLETIDDFYQRCVQAQYLVADDIRDASFDREVLLHFLIGLIPDVRDLVLASECSSPENYISEARKHFIQVKDEPLEPDVKIEEVNANEVMDEEDDVDDIEMKYDDEFEDVEDQPLSVAKRISKFKCLDCPKKFKSQKWLDKHKKKEHSGKKATGGKSSQWAQSHGYKCQICSEIFANKDDREFHERNNHKDLNRTCEFCNEVCLDLKALGSHVTLKHCPKTDDGKTVCIFCKKVQRRNRAYVRYHMLAEHYNDPSFKCKHCGKVIVKTEDMQHHIQTVHEKLKPHQCETCGKSFKSLRGMRDHIAVSHEKKENLKCDVEGCDKTFTNKIRLEHHRRLGHKTFVCDLCGKAYKAKVTLKMHCISEHTSVEEKEKHLFRCEHPECEFTSLFKKKVQIHYERLHLKLKNFLCQHCPKGYYSKIEYEEHLNGVHLNIKPYTCDLCGYASAYNRKLQEHHKVVHGNQKYDCPMCNYSAKYDSNLTKHIQKVHKSTTKEQPTM